MRRLVFLLLLVFVQTTVFDGSGSRRLWSEEPVCPIEGAWVFSPELSDEFNGDALDGGKWWDFNPAWGGRRPGFFSRDNVTVSDGCLRLTARSTRPEERTVERTVRGEDRFATSIVKSKARIRYGYFEARFKSMRANVCNAFWLYDPLDPPTKYREGDVSEEIDVFEVFGKPESEGIDRVYYATVHCYVTPYVESLVNFKKEKLPDYSGKRKVDFDFWSDFHVAGLLWTPETLTWYLDGQPVHTRVNDIFHRPLHLVFDSEIMETWSGLPLASDLPSTFQIDYLRVWRLPSAGEE